MKTVDKIWKVIRKDFIQFYKYVSESKLIKLSIKKNYLFKFIYLNNKAFY